ncbi:hypothetical protein HG531_004435 [Fusarium graminearum]|nr:hypothetical protein HG531_004435 [Fusarium graminearum]
MALAPLLNTGDVVVDLETTLPGEEVSSHQQVVERCHTNQLEELSDGLRDDGVLQVVGLHRAENAVKQAEQVVHAVSGGRVRLKKLAQESAAFVGNEARERLGLNDGRDNHLLQLLLQHLHPSVVDVKFQALKIVLDNLQKSVVLVVVRLLGLVPVLSEEHEGQHLVHVGQPESARVDGLIAIVLHHLLLDGLHNVGQEAL